MNTDVINNVPRESLENWLIAFQCGPTTQHKAMAEIEALLATTQPAADGEREQFEAWYASEYFCGDRECAAQYLTFEGGKYWQRDPQEAWRAWQARAAQPAKAEGVAVPGAWIVGNGNQDKWRMWGDYGPEWTPDRDKALQFARRCDAEAFAAEDEDAWAIVQLAAAPVPPVQENPNV